MQILQLNKPYHPERARWPEAYQYNYDVSGHELLLFVRGLSNREIEGVRTGKAQFCLSVHGPIIFLHWRFALAFRWSECPYSWHMVHPENRKLPSLDYPRGWGVPLTVILVEAENGLVKALRLVTFSNRFTIELHRAIITQAGQPFDQQDYDRQLAAVYARYTSTQLLKTARVKCTAGKRDESE